MVVFHPLELHWREPHTRKVYETEVESEQEHDATEEEDFLEVELSVEEDELVEEDIAQKESDGEDSEVPSAAEATFSSGWRAKQKTADIMKARSFQELPLSKNAKPSGGKGTGAARDVRPRDHRDDLRAWNSQCAA